jgi:hypothetical protein
MGTDAWRGEWGREMDLPGGPGFTLWGGAASSSKPKSRVYFVFGVVLFFRVISLQTWDFKEFKTSTYPRIRVF